MAIYTADFLLSKRELSAVICHMWRNLNTSASW